MSADTLFFVLMLVLLIIGAIGSNIVVVRYWERRCKLMAHQSHLEGFRAGVRSTHRVIAINQAFRERRERGAGLKAIIPYDGQTPQRITLTPRPALALPQS